MQHAVSFLFFLVSLALLGGPALAQTVPPLLVSYPEMILHNGKIATMDDKSTTSNPGTIAQALAIREGKVLATGNNQQMLALRGPQTKVVDLRGRTVVPGIIDTHSHLFDYALDAQEDQAVRVRIRATAGETWESVKKKTLDAVRQEVAKKKPGEWIALQLPNDAVDKDGKVMNGIVASRRGLINRSELDQLAPNNPVYLRVRTTSIVNSRSIEIVKNIQHAKPDYWFRLPGPDPGTVGQTLQGRKFALGELRRHHMVQLHALGQGTGRLPTAR
jgi:predicted amidohydrolase YtcJ